MEEYIIRVTTSSAKRSGTDGSVKIVMHGVKGTSNEISLHRSETHNDKFERGHTDVFRVKSADIGYVQVVLTTVLSMLISTVALPSTLYYLLA